jgi:hypothetical protein
MPSGFTRKASTDQRLAPLTLMLAASPWCAFPRSGTEVVHDIKALGLALVHLRDIHFTTRSSWYRAAQEIEAKT